MNKEAILRGFLKRASQYDEGKYDGRPVDLMKHYMAGYQGPAKDDPEPWDTWDPKDPHIQRMSKLYTAIHKKYPNNYIPPGEFDSTIAYHGANYAGLYNKKHNLKMPNRKQFKTDQEAWDAEDKMSNKMLNDEMYKFRDLRHFSNARSKEFHNYVTSLTPKQFMNYQAGKL